MADMQAYGHDGVPGYGDSIGQTSGATAAGAMGAAAGEVAGKSAGKSSGRSPVQSVGTIVNFAGAAVSLALVLGVGVWGYNLVTRDVSGVPVVRAAEGPMRIMPDDPGGALAENQGLAVNQVAAVGAAEAPADRLILAPQPIDLDSADSTPVAQTPADDAGAADDISVEALVNQLLKEAQPIEATTTDQMIQPASLTTDTAAPNAQPTQTPAIKTVAGGIGTSLRPKLRPANAPRVASLTGGPVAPTAQEVAASSLPAGTRLAQLGAYESEAIARKEWDRLSGRFGDFLKDKQRVVQKAQSGGRTFYRLRAHGFADISDARRFCAALQAEKAECIPVTSK